MRPGTLPLIIVFAASVIAAGLLGGYLHEQELKIAPTRDRVSKAPLAGFHKFAADIEWMRFIQYCGATGGVTGENADEFKKRIDRIIALDPDFERIYYEGALMLASRKPEYALEIIDRGIANPHLANSWRLPLAGGSTVIRPQLDKVYRDQEPDRAELERAKDYFARTVKIPGRPEYALNALIRTDAMLRDGDYPREIKELEAWYEEWNRAYFGSMGGYGEEGTAVSEGSEFSGEYGYGPEGSADYSAQVMRAMRTASRESADHPRFKELSAKILSEVFKSQHIDPYSLSSYDPGDQFSAESGKPVEVYGVCLKCGKDSKGRYTVLKGAFCHICGTDCSKIWNPQPAEAAPVRNNFPK